MIHTHRLPDVKSTKSFWQIQASIILQMRIIRSRSLFLAFVSSEHDSKAVSSFVSMVEQHDWVVSDSVVEFPSYGDTIASSVRVLIGAYSMSTSDAQPVHIPVAPSCPSTPIARFIWPPFNIRTYAVSYSKDSTNFSKDVSDSDSPANLRLSDPIPCIQASASFQVLYRLHTTEQDDSIQAGSEVVSTSHLCPPYRPNSQNHLFGPYFGIKYRCDDDTFIRAISPFEFSRCFGLSDNLTYHLSKKDYQHQLDNGIPSRTSSSILILCYDRLKHIRDSNTQIFDPSNHSAPAALANVFLNGSVAARLPDAKAWSEAYDDDPETRLIKSMISNPSLVTRDNLLQVHHSLRMPLRQGLFVSHNDMIILRKPVGLGSDSYCQMRLVPRTLRKIIFIAFHANPIGGHLNHIRTFRNIRLRYFWPVKSYAKDQALLLDNSRAVAKILLEEHRSYHKELINAS